MYTIKPRQKRAAKRLGVSIKPSTTANKKIDICKDDKKISSIGDINYNDNAIYLKSNGLKDADNRKRLYKIRHEKTRKVVGSKSYYADQILLT